MDGRDHSRSNLYLNLHSLPRYASFSHLLPLYPSQCGSITRHVNADRNGLPALALPLYASSRCHFMLQGTDSVTSPIGVQSWNHSFAKIGRIALGLRAALPDEQPTVLYLFGLPNQDQSTSRLQRYASDWNSAQTYASKSQLSQLLGPAQSSKPTGNARNSLQTYASSRANLWVK
jgi:hypothetical protein